MIRRGALIFALGMLICVFVLVMTWGQTASLRAEAADIRNQQNILEGKMRRQQSEFEELEEELPLLRAETAETAPLAEAAMTADDEAKTLRRQLRKDVQALKEEVARAAFAAAWYENAALQDALAALDR